MKIIWNNSESAAPVAPLSLATEEGVEEFFDAMEQVIKESEEKAEEEKPSGRGFGW